MLIEIMRFHLDRASGEEEFLAADRRVQEEFAYRRPGLWRRTTARAQNGAWIVVDLWRSVEDADAADAEWERDPVAQSFMAHLDVSSVTTERYTTLD